MATIEALEDQVAALEATLAGAGTVVSTFEGELARMRDTMLFTGREVNTLSAGIGGGLRRAFDGLVFDGVRLSDALRSVGKSIADTFYNTALRPVQNALGGFVANGLNGLLSSVQPFAKGGVVSGPTNFAMRGGMGLMGEAGPEAILPLARGADGRLGIQAGGGARGDGRDEHHDAGCAGFPAQPDADRGTGIAGVIARAAEQIGAG